MNRSIKPLRVLQLKPRLLAEFVTVETLLMPEFKSNTRQRVLDFQLDRKPTRDDGKPLPSICCWAALRGNWGIDVTKIAISVPKSGV